MAPLAHDPSARWWLWAGGAALAAILESGLSWALGAPPPVPISLLLGLQWGFLIALSVATATLVPRRRFLAASLATCALPIAYAFGWIVRAGTGRFLDAAAVAFAARNLALVLGYLVQAEPRMIFLVATAVVGAVGAWIVVWRVRAGRGDIRLWWRRALGSGAALVLVASLAARGEAHRVAWSPLLAMAAGALAREEDPGSAACLAAESLVPSKPSRSPTGPDRNGPSLLVVAVESLRADVPFLEHQGREVMPTLNRLAREGLLLTRVWSASTHSDYADPAALSGLYPLRSRRHHYYREDDPWPRRLLWDHLAPAGYATAVVSSQNEGWGGMDAFLRTPGLSHFYDARSAAREGLPTRAPAGDEALAALAAGDRLRAGKLDDALTADAALAWIRGLPPGKTFALAMNVQSTHFPYELAESAPRPFRPADLDFPLSFSGYPPDRIPEVRNAYFNALAYVDRQLARLLDGLDAAGRLENTLVVVYGENGELFGEHGLFTHAGAPYEPALRVPVVLLGPGVEPGREEFPTSLVDLVPMVLGRLGAGGPFPSAQGVDVLASDRPDSTTRPVFFHNENPWSRVDGVVVGGRWKLWRDRDDGTVRLFDLHTDPGETRDLARRDPARAAQLEALVREWRCRQLSYYENPLLYGSYWPPPPPETLPPSAAPEPTAAPAGD